MSKRTPNALRAYSIDLEAEPPRFSWLPPEAQAQFDAWFKDNGQDFDVYRQMPPKLLAALLFYANWQRDESAQRPTAREALALGPPLRRAVVQWFVHWRFPEWQQTARGQWADQVAARKRGELEVIDTYDAMARRIQEWCHDGPTPSHTLIKRAINGLRPTLAGKRRRNATK